MGVSSGLTRDGRPTKDFRVYNGSFGLFFVKLIRKNEIRSSRQGTGIPVNVAGQRRKFGHHAVCIERGSVHRPNDANAFRGREWVFNGLFRGGVKV